MTALNPTQCSRCHGRGQVRDIDTGYPRRCPDCGGTGTREMMDVLTDDTPLDMVWSR